MSNVPTNKKSSWRGDIDTSGRSSCSGFVTISIVVSTNLNVADIFTKQRGSFYLKDTVTT